MKSIQQRLLFFTLLPFLAVYIAFSAFIVFQVYQIQEREIKLQLHNEALYNEVNLKKCYDTMELAVQFSASELENIDPDDPAAREIGEHVITSRFRNPYVVYAWLIFEPNAFDGKDFYYMGDYPGVASGRYIRSFFREGNSWKTLDNIDGVTLEDRDKSYFYVIPKETGTFFTDIGIKELLKDYGSGPESSFGLSQPIFRNGEFIGCVGLDALINEETLGGRIYPHSISAIFLSDGRLGYSLDTEKVGKNLEELGFGDSAEVMDHLINKTTEYFYSGYSGLFNTGSFNYFYPVKINENTVFIYTSVPQKDVWLNTIPVLLPIGASFIISLVVFAFLFVYLSRGIVTPLKKLTEASENIVSGNLDMNISVVNTKDEMRMISMSLLRMAEQFRTSKLLQERYYDRYDIILKIHYALFRSTTLNDAFNSLLTTISGYYGINKASLVFLLKDNPTIVAVYPAVVREEGNSTFFAHNQVKQLLEDKKHLTLNGRALEVAQFPFIDYSTKSLCILPLRVEDILRGYIIMEGKKQETLVHDDTTLIFLGDILSYIMGFRVDWEQEVTSTEKHSKGDYSGFKQDTVQELFLTENDDAFLEKAKNIQNLDIEKGILLIGGEKKKYTELLKVTIRVISEEMIKMRRFHEEDMAAFAVEVHGLKAALYNIGAETLGDEARQLEFAAKSDDATYCIENYPFFEEKLRVFSRNLAALFPHQERNYRKGEIEELEEALLQAWQACDVFDVSTANTLLAPLAFLKWDNEVIQKSLQSILSDMENLEYDGMADKISALLEIIKDKEK